MKEITSEDYKKFIKEKKFVIIEGQKIELVEKPEIKELQPKDFKLEETTVWSFPERGKWATHYLNSKYRGNWAPQVPRNLILKYTNPGDVVLDPMVGSGTTAIECKLLGRNCIACDINPDAIMVTLNRLDFSYNPIDPNFPKTWIKTYVADARNLNLIEDNSIDLIATHPPYFNIIKYSDGVEGDLSNINNLEEYLKAMRDIAKEFYRVLKPGKHCTILIGDTRKNKHYIPIAFRVMQQFLDVGFILKEDIIKIQHKMKATREVWNKKTDFYKIYHEHLFVFRKPEKEEEKIGKYRYNIKWW